MNHSEFTDWLKKNSFERDATAQVKEMFRHKSIEQIAELGYYDVEMLNHNEGVRNLNFWKDNYDQVTSWYQLEYFFERSIEELEEDWNVGELFVPIEWKRPLGHNDFEVEEGLCWGIKNEMHLNLKLKEWADCWNRGAIINQTVYDGIPLKFGGDIGR
jgi:hypothetical protein